MYKPFSVLRRAASRASGDAGEDDVLRYARHHFAGTRRELVAVPPEMLRIQLSQFVTTHLAGLGIRDHGVDSGVHHQPGLRTRRNESDLAVASSVLAFASLRIWREFKEIFGQDVRTDGWLQFTGSATILISVEMATGDESAGASIAKIQSKRPWITISKRRHVDATFGTARLGLNSSQVETLLVEPCGLSSQ